MFGKAPEAIGRNKEGMEMLLNSGLWKDAVWRSHTTGAKQMARAQTEQVHCSVPSNRYPQTALEQDKHLAGIAAVACTKRYAVGFRHASCGNLTSRLLCISPATLIINRNASDLWQTWNKLILLHNEQKKFLEAQSADKAGYAETPCLGPNAQKVVVIILYRPSSRTYHELKSPGTQLTMVSQRDWSRKLHRKQNIAFTELSEKASIILLLHLLFINCSYLSTQFSTPTMSCWKLFTTLSTLCWDHLLKWKPVFC